MTQQPACLYCTNPITQPNQWGAWFRHHGWLQEELHQAAGLCEECARTKLTSVDRLDLIRQRLAGATPGRWQWATQYRTHPILISLSSGHPVVLAPGLDEEGYERNPLSAWQHTLIQARVGKPSRLVPLTPDHPDAKLIADAPTLLRWAVEEIEKLRKEKEARP